LLAALDDSKAEEIVVLDVSRKTSLADTIIVCTGRSNVHMGAIADRIAKAVKVPGGPPPRIEGLNGSEWVLIDVGDAIIHIFRPEARLFYNLEKLWGEGRPDEGAPPEPPAKKAVRAKKPPEALARPISAKTVVKATAKAKPGAKVAAKPIRKRAAPAKPR
jgi:ribosome-associated protein